MAMRAARCSTAPQSFSAARTPWGSRMSPANTSNLLRTSAAQRSSHPHELKELYRTNARTSYPARTKASVRCEPMKPSAPVTSIFLGNHPHHFLETRTRFEQMFVSALGDDSAATELHDAIATPHRAQPVC